jgi:hypothetical protein
MSILCILDFYDYESSFLPLRCQGTTSGLYYKLITIVIDAASVMLQIVASLTIVIDDVS